MFHYVLYLFFVELFIPYLYIIYKIMTKNQKNHSDKIIILSKDKAKSILFILLKDKKISNLK